MIFSLSIGADRDFKFNISTSGERAHVLRQKDIEDRRNETHLNKFGYNTQQSFEVQSVYTMKTGDLICMPEELNLRYKHGVSPGYGIRYSITARTIHTYCRTNIHGQIILICPYFNFVDKKFLSNSS
jgi:hypothetical protein